MLKYIILILVIAAIIGSAALYIYKEKKRGVKCIGCPNGCSCSSGGCGGNCICCGGGAETK